MTNRNDLDTYLSDRKLLVESHRSVAESFDKALLTLSTGALGVSIIFIQQIAPKPATQPSLLIVAWVALAISLTFSLVALLISQRAMMRAIEINEALYRLRAEAKQPEKKDTANPAAGLIQILNWVCLGTFAIGITLLLWFAWINYR